MDDNVSEVYQTHWSALSHDLAKLNSLKFPWFVTSEECPADFYILGDASKRFCSLSRARLWVPPGICKSSGDTSGA